ncbi:MAG: response regulator transcription factor [Chloroflexi bacterium]|nr:response regulator transcription factor [Chloroflexota bacterium]
MKPPLKVMLVDDHELVRVGLRTLIGGEPGFVIVGEASSVAEAIPGAAACQPDVILMDVRLPDGSGVDACREIRSANPAVRVLMLTSYADEDAILSAIVAGAAGYLLKQAKASVLLDAIECVGRGGSLLDPIVTQKVLEHLRSTARGPAPDDRLAGLSEQERKILPLLADGLTNREIADRLFLSEHTVKAYVSDLLNKLHLRRRSEAAAFFARQQDQRSF